MNTYPSYSFYYHVVTHVNVTVVSYALTVKAIPRPSTSFSKGDPKHEDTPIAGCPALATAVSATQSPTELPIASTVRPRMAIVDNH